MKRNRAQFPLNSGKLIAFLIFVFVSILTTTAQQAKSPLDVEIYKLDNGLTIYLNEDHSLPSVFGAVAVKGGSKRDPAEATGIAHYFEHIMFKGTDQIGTLDYATEKTYLDSIAVLYDRLAETSDAEQKAIIQKDINRLSVKASEFAIPSETEKILGEMGGTGLNAGTGNDQIVYYNIFPSNQIEKWLDVYSQRFINPVYRLFQSELETVYEEYNMYMDNRFSTAFEEFLRAFYPDFPYGVPVIGYPDHLKNPSMKRMNEYFETYYVANNMALVLSGNFDPELVKPMIRKYFEVWKQGVVPPMPEKYKVQPIQGKQVIQKKLTPVKFGILAYRSVPNGHEDGPALDVINRLLSNQSLTGLLDELSVENKVLVANSIGMRFNEAGGEIILFVPKILGQSLKKAEALVNEKLGKLKSGEFDDKLLEAVKTQIIVEYGKNFEDQYARGNMMIMAFTGEKDWKDVVAYPDKIKALTREEILHIAKKYYDENLLVFYSKTGLPKKPKALKPPFEPIPSANSEKTSEYAKKIKEMPVPDLEPDFIDFGPPEKVNNEVTLLDLNPLAHLYYVENKVNNIFNLTLSFGTGSYQVPVLNQLAEYMELTGTTTMSFSELSKSMQELGASYDIWASEDGFNVTISGLDVNMEQILGLVSQLLYSPGADVSKIKNLYESAKANVKIEQKDPESLGVALYMYAVYGKHSPFINRLTSAEIKELVPDTLIAALKKVMAVEVDIHYSGTISLPEVSKILTSRLLLDQITVKGNSPVRKDYVEYKEPVVYFLDDPKAIQSKNYFYIPGNTVDETQKPLMNAYYEYLDGGMHSLIFQEIREFRSLAYSTGAFLFMPNYPDEKANLTAYVGTQADKTKEAIEVMHQIITNKPAKSERIDNVRRSLIQSINSSKPAFRGLSGRVADFKKKNYDSDPREKWVEVYRTMNFEDIVGAFNGQFAGKPTVTTIIGNQKMIDTNWLKPFGKIVEVSKKDIFR